MCLKTQRVTPFRGSVSLGISPGIPGILPRDQQAGGAELDPACPAGGWMLAVGFSVPCPGPLLRLLEQLEAVWTSLFTASCDVGSLTAWGSLSSSQGFSQNEHSRRCRRKPLRILPPMSQCYSCHILLIKKKSKSQPRLKGKGPPSDVMLPGGVGLPGQALFGDHLHTN